MVSALATRLSRILVVVVVVLGAGVATAAPGTSQTEPVDLGTAEDFAVLSGTGITDAPGSGSGPGSDITGDIGVSPESGTTITGITCVQMDGTIYTVDAAGPGGSCHTPNSAAVLTTAKNDLTAAYVDVTARTADGTVPPELGGQTFGPGLYDSDTTAFLISALEGALILDGGGDEDAVFIFRALLDDASSLTVGPGSQVQLIGGAQACNIWWVVNGATIDVGADFVGNVLAATSITVNDAATIEGRLLAQTGNVTLINDTITVSVCATDDGGGGGPGDDVPGGGPGDSTPGGGGDGGGSGDSSDDASGQRAMSQVIFGLPDAPPALTVQPDLLG